MRKISIYALLLVASACMSFEGNPYGDDVRRLSVQLVYPEGYGDRLREGVAVTLADRNSSNVYTALTDASGAVEFRVTTGRYRLAVSDKPDPSSIFNGTVEQVDLIAGDAALELLLGFSWAGSVVIKEVYSAGCPMDDKPGAYTYDKYIVLHNNSGTTQYLDGLCLCMVAPYNSKVQSNPWTSLDSSGNIVFRDYAAVPDAIWQFAGGGEDFPLEPGADAVVAYWGVDHTQTYSQSVNLNREEYFVLYDQLLYPGTSTWPTPAPGDRIRRERWLRVLKKTGRSGQNGANTYVISDKSPAVVLFRAPLDFDLEGYLSDDLLSTILSGNIVYSKVPWEWIVDGVDISDNTGSANHKRLRPDVDAGAVGYSGVQQGHTIHRRLDEEATEEYGFEVYMDTNNSSNDFYERETQSLRES